MHTCEFQRCFTAFSPFNSSVSVIHLLLKITTLKCFHCVFVIKVALLTHIYFREGFIIFPMKRILLVVFSTINKMKGRLNFTTGGIDIGITSMKVAAPASVPFSSTSSTALWAACKQQKRHCSMFSSVWPYSQTFPF